MKLSHRFGWLHWIRLRCVKNKRCTRLLEKVTFTCLPSRVSCSVFPNVRQSEYEKEYMCLLFLTAPRHTLQIGKKTHTFTRSPISVEFVLRQPQDNVPVAAEKSARKTDFIPPGRAPFREQTFLESGIILQVKLITGFTVLAGLLHRLSAARLVMEQKTKE